MSRSRRCYPVVTDQQRKPGVHFWKRLAAKVARRAELADGGAYRRIFNPWHICDYRFAAWRLSAWSAWAKDDRRWWAK